VSFPEGWRLRTVADVGESGLGLMRSPARHTGTDIRPYLRVANVFEARIDLSDVDTMNFNAEERAKYLLRHGDILLNEGQTPELLGRPAMWTGQVEEMYFTKSLLRFRAGEEVLPAWALLVFRRHMHMGRFMQESRVTTNIAHLALVRFKTVEFPVPPLDDQRRIVDELERRLSHIAAAERALARSAALLRTARLSILMETLTPQNDRRGWSEVALGELASIRLGRQRSPKNHAGANMRPYLRAGNVTWTGLRLDDVKEMHFSEREAETYVLQPGDIVMSEASGSAGEVGKPALWSGEIDGCCFQNTLIRLRCTDAVDPAFLMHRLRLEALLGRWAQGYSRGVGIHHLGATRLAGWRVAIPDISQQLRLVAEVERRLSILDGVERSVTSGVRKIRRTTRALLDTAYHGDLILPSAGSCDTANTPNHVLKVRS
jgi:type I restriction enzyme S subunit